MLRVLGILAKGMLRATVSKAGFRNTETAARYAVGILIASVVIANALGIVAARNIGQTAGSNPAPFALALLWFQASGIVVLVQNIGIGQSTIARGLRLVAFSPAEHVLASALPLLFVAGLSCLTLLAPAAHIIWANTDTPLPVALIECVLVTVTGSCAGFLAWAAAAALCDKIRPLRTHTYPVSLFLYSGLITSGLPILAEQVDQVPAGGTRIPSPIAALYSWPAVANYATTQRLIWLPIAVAVIALTVAGTVFVAVLSAPFLLKDLGPARQRFAWASRRALPLYRLEVIRLLRNRRNITALGTAVVMGGLGMLGALMSYRNGVSDIDIAPVIGVVLTIPAAQITLLARGINDRPHPYQLLLGFRPAHWATAVSAAAVSIAVAACAPVMTAAWFVPGVDHMSLRVVIAYQLLVFFGTAAFGAFTRPGRDNPAGEFVGLLLVSGAAAALLAGFVARYGADHAALPPIVAVLLLCLVPAPALIEQARWNRLVPRVAP